MLSPLFAAVKLQCDSDVGELWIALAINHDLQGGMAQSSGLAHSQAHRHLGVS